MVLKDTLFSESIEQNGTTQYQTKTKVSYYGVFSFQILKKFSRFRSDDDYSLTEEVLLKKVPSNVSDASDDNTFGLENLYWFSGNDIHNLILCLILKI